ncbi:MAG: hypothetical protein JO197_19620 [Acidobacteria bacterium]|nr:hypothetical protein [Acidobacteriota bacterium]MBV9478568.1 hypothetical protein [Acidobacteriota bacterium]
MKPKALLLTAVCAVALNSFAQETASAASDRFVAIAPCRLVDTRVDAPDSSSDETTRRLNIASTRCGRLVPASAIAYAVRVTSMTRAIPHVAPTPGTPGPLVRFPAGAVASFPVAMTENVAVDIEGYYVRPGTVVDPTDETTTGATTSAQKMQAAVVPLRPGAPQTNVTTSGTAGDLFLDAASPWSSAGFVGVARAATPWTILKAGDSAGTGGFAVYDSNQNELLRVGSNGDTRLRGTNYFSGRTSYHESSSISGNVVHEVRIVNPRDSAGTNNNRVTFYNARSDDEVGSPATTKFQAFTLGYYTQKDINFDSQIYYHFNPTFPNYDKYYFRGLSAVENKETFWVKAATNSTGVSQTRADMYVSGLTTIGDNAAETATRLKVNGSVDITGNIAAKYQDVAEWVPAAADLEVGTVVVLARGRVNEVAASSHAYDTAVAGVVSAHPGVVLGEAGATKEMIATTGRVRVKVDARRAPIEVGDLLVSSDVAGTAMKSIPIEVGGRAFHQPGTIVGKALEPLASGTGEILVLLSLQ